MGKFSECPALSATDVLGVTPGFSPLVHFCSAILTGPSAPKNVGQTCRFPESLLFLAATWTINLSEQRRAVKNVSNRIKIYAPAS
jgi:hypothetical protein